MPATSEQRLIAVTGASRGIGAAIARTLHRDGATLVLVDIPGAGDHLAAVANEVHGTTLQLDISSEDAGERIIHHAVQRQFRRRRAPERVEPSAPGPYFQRSTWEVTG